MAGLAGGRPLTPSGLEGACDLSANRCMLFSDSRYGSSKIASDTFGRSAWPCTSGLQTCMQYRSLYAGSYGVHTHTHTDRMHTIILWWELEAASYFHWTFH